MEFIQQLIPLALAVTIPILITSLGGLFSERSGVVNIGLEGLMIIGAFTVSLSLWIYTDKLGNDVTDGVIWIFILISGLAGALFAVLHAIASISLKADQVISGTAINLLAGALGIFFARAVTGSQNITTSTLTRYSDFGFITKIPIIGLLFKDFYISTFVILAIVVLTWYLIFKTPYGLRLRACGEFPQAADSMGVNVVKMRYQAVIMSGLFAGIGGAVLIVTTNGQFTGYVSGLGFLALASLIFGKWKPFNVLASTLFFGTMRTLASLAKVNDTLKSFQLPLEFYNALPFVLTLVALIIFSKNAAAPSALGEPYDAGKR